MSGTIAKPAFRRKEDAARAKLNDALNAKDVPPPDRAEAIKRARALLAHALKDREAPPYPTAALGPLAPACEAIATAAQVQPAMVGQCLLGAASLLTQGLFNVETLAGRRPLSLYLLTLGDSGDGKSTAQGAALAPVEEWQRQQARDYSQDLKDHEGAKSKRKKGDDPPEAPQCPFRLVSDATVEGLRRDLDTGVCSQGVFTDEAAAILSGYGMSPDHRSKTAGVFSKLWDNGHLSVSRATGGRVERYGIRIAVHWLVQPLAASESIGDPMLSALGFWPRFLIAWPAPQEPRIAQAFHPDRLPAVAAYWARCNELLSVGLPDDAGDSPTLLLSGDARKVLNQAFGCLEQDSRRGSLRPVKPFGLRACEQACRVAGVLAAFAGRGEVSEEDMRSALALVGYSLKTWREVIDQGAADPSAAHGLRLYEWLTERPGWSESPAVVVNAGPACVRTKGKRDAALSVLEAASLVAMVDGKVQALAPKSGEA
jgi:hypothetical protein